MRASKYLDYGVLAKKVVGLSAVDVSRDIHIEAKSARKGLLAPKSVDVNVSRPFVAELEAVVPHPTGTKHLRTCHRRMLFGSYAEDQSIRRQHGLFAASSLGAVAYFLLTGTHVFSGATLVEVCSHHLHTPPTPPSERLGRPLPHSLEALVLACLAKRPEDRPASALAVAQRLSAIADLPRWTEEDAQAWWSDHRAKLESFRAASAPTASPSLPVLGVDLRQR